MAERGRSGKPVWQKKMALDRIRKLFLRADREFKKHPKRSNRYVELARKIAMRYNVQIPKSLKRRFCKRCYRYLVPGVNCQVRTRAGQRAVIVKCLE